jgi:hypothetical protein
VGAAWLRRFATLFAELPNRRSAACTPLKALDKALVIAMPSSSSVEVK